MQAVPTGKKTLIIELLTAGKLESAQDVMAEYRIELDESAYQQVFEQLKQNLRRKRTQGEVREANRLKRRIKALETFRVYGLDPEKLVPSVDMPEGYHGKILLAAVSGGMADGLICLRSGDDWHHEILGNTQEEIRDLGFENSLVVPAGGASVRFDQKSGITVYGSSDAFGTCDKQIAAGLIRKAFPEKTVYTRQ
jgi:hypothetical protein